MKLKYMILSTLATFVLAGCESEKSQKQEQVKLEAQAKVSKADAQVTALAQAPNGTVKECELEKEKGKLIWSFGIATPGSKDITEVNIDAVTGALVNVEKEKD